MAAPVRHQEDGMLADKPLLSQELESGRGTRSRGSLRGLSDRTIAWLFILPTILLLLAINIFPLVWALRLSFTNFKSNMPSVPARFIGIDNYVDILTDEDIWYAMQVTARFWVRFPTISMKPPKSTARHPGASSGRSRCP